MYIKNNMTDTEGFALDTARIGNTSTSKTKIVLPYNGSLPVDLRGTTSAAIVITLQVGLTVNILLTVERDRRKYRYPVKATPEEIDHILQSFFFDADGQTRRSTGLDRYSLGLWQGSYISLCWRNTGLTIFFSNLPPLPSKECCSISDTAKRHNASKGKRPRFAPGALLCRGSKERPATPGEPSHFQNHILSDICSQYLSSIAYP